MAAYTKLGPFIDVPQAQWSNPPDGAESLSAAVFDHFEDGIAAAQAAADAAAADAAAGGSPTWANMPAGSLSFVDQDSDGSWPDRRTSRTDVKTIFTKIVPGSADPPPATAPAVNGAYPNDVVIGV